MTNSRIRYQLNRLSKFIEFFSDPEVAYQYSRRDWCLASSILHHKHKCRILHCLCTVNWVHKLCPVQYTRWRL